MHTKINKNVSINDIIHNLLKVYKNDMCNLYKFKS